MKKVLSLVLALLMIVPMGAFGVSADAITPDVTWYDETQSEFTITTVEQLFGLSQLSNQTNFAGKTVKLGADLVVNEGDSELWEDKAPAISWTPIYEFFGTFDGQGHTISGLYTKGAAGVGLICFTSNSTVIKNTRLENCYFEAANGYIGSFAGLGAGLYENLYSNAFVICDDHFAGGMVGLGDGETVRFEGCWFDGYLEVKQRYGGGMLGGSGDKAWNVIAKNCLNTGYIYSKYSADAMSHIAGIVGRHDRATLIEDCLNVGVVTSAYQDAGLTDTIGGVFGFCGACYMTEDNKDWISRVDVVNCWSSKESCHTGIGGTASTAPDQKLECTLVAEQLLKGYNAYLNTNLDFENHWAVNLDGFPVPKALAKTIPPLYDLSVPELSDAEVKAEGHYGPRWTLTLQLPEGFGKDDVEVGVLIVPTKAIPSDHAISLLDESFTYRGNEYEIANVKAEIFRESADDELVATFVVTDLCELNARTSFTAIPYAVYSVEGTDPIQLIGEQKSAIYYKDAVLSLEDASVSADQKAMIEAVLAPIDQKIGGRFPVSEEWSEKDLFETVPPLLLENGIIGEAVDCGAGNFVITVDGTMDADYYAYLEDLEQYGFTKHSDNGEKGIHDVIYTTTFVKDDLVLTVTDLCYRNQIAISATWDLPLSDHLFDNYKDDVKEGAKTTLSMMEMWWYGASAVIQLKNGHFIINDGATDQELGYLLNYLEKLAPQGEKPVIEGWFFSHLHYDHSYCLKSFITNPKWADRVIVEGFYFSEPSQVVMDMDLGVAPQLIEEKQAIGLLKDSEGNTPKVYRPQTGQRYYFSDISVDVMLSQENIPVSTYADGFNESSIWLEYNIDGQNVCFAGDSGEAGMTMMMDLYDKEHLDWNVFFSLHHGENTMDEFTEYCTFKTILNAYHVYDDDEGARKLDLKAISNHGESLVEGDGTVVLTFPYSTGEYEVLEPTNWIYHRGQDRVWQD